MAQNIFDHSQYPRVVGDDGRDPAVSGSYYFRSASGVGEEVTDRYGQDIGPKDYYAQVGPGSSSLYTKIVIYWEGVKRFDQEFSSQFVPNPVTPSNQVHAAYTIDYSQRREVSGFLEFYPVSRFADRSLAANFHYTTREIFTDSRAAPITLMKPLDSALVRDQVENEADYYLYGWNRSDLYSQEADTPANLAATDTNILPFAVGCSVSMKFDFTLNGTGVLEVSQAVYNAVRPSSPSTDHKTYVHTADKRKCRHVRSTFTSGGRYFIRTDDFIISQGGNNISSNDELFYSDSGYTATYAGGAVFFGYSSAAPRVIQYVGAMFAGVGDYIFDDKNRIYYRIVSKTGTTFGELHFDQDHHFKDIENYNIHFSPDPRQQPFPVPLVASGSFYNCYKSFAIYALDGFADWNVEFRHQTQTDVNNGGVIYNALPALYGKSGPNVSDRCQFVLTDSDTPDEFTLVTNNGVRGNEFAVVPNEDGLLVERAFGTIHLASYWASIIANNSWLSHDVELSNCTIHGDTSKINTVVAVKPIRENEHFRARLNYRARKTLSGSSPVHTITQEIKGFHLKASSDNVITKTFGGGGGSTVVDGAEVVGDQELELIVKADNLLFGTDIISQQPAPLDVVGATNCQVLTTNSTWQEVIPDPGGNSALDTISCYPVRILPTDDNWSVLIRVRLAYIHFTVNFINGRFFPDYGMQVFSPEGLTRLNSSTRHPRILYQFEGLLNFPSETSVPEFLMHADNNPLINVGLTGMRTFEFRDGEFLWNPFAPQLLDLSLKKFGLGSIGLNGTNEYVVSGAESGFNSFKMEQEDFTIECQVYPKTVKDSTIIDMRYRSTSDKTPFIRIKNNRFQYLVANSVKITSNSNIVANQWYHLAISRSGSTTRMFVNGVSQGSFTDNIDYNDSPGGIAIGGNGYFMQVFENFSGDFFHGNIDEIISNRTVATYTSNFTPPSSQSTGGAVVTIGSDVIPELVELVDDGTWHISQASEGGRNDVSFDYINKQIRITETRPLAGSQSGNFNFPGDNVDPRFARFHVFRV